MESLRHADRTAAILTASPGSAVGKSPPGYVLATISAAMRARSLFDRKRRDRLGRFAVRDPGRAAATPIECRAREYAD
jgi:hypothetical protein